MARMKSKSVYDRITEKQESIREAEEMLNKLNDELQELFKERDDLEMRQLFEQMRANNLDINKAIDLLAKAK